MPLPNWLNPSRKGIEREDAFLKSLDLSNEQIQEVRKHFHKRMNATVLKAILIGAIAATCGIFLSDYHWNKKVSHMKKLATDKHYESAPKER